MVNGWKRGDPMKPSSKSEARYSTGVLKGRNHKAYFAGSKPFLKRKLARARRLAEKRTTQDE